MAHKFQSYLDEFKLSIDKLVPLTPQEIVKESEELHQELSNSENTTEKQIHQALSHIGRKEFPYRKAYLQICAGDEEQRLQKASFERLDPKIKKKVESFTKHGVLMDHLIKSKIFQEEFTPEERYQVEQSMLLSEDTLDAQCDERAHKRKAEYSKMVDDWTKKAEKLQILIDQLRILANENPEYSNDINAVVNRLEEGWSIVEEDPTEEGIKKEIEYWNTVLNEESTNEIDV